jgi:hypothetical protein
VSVKLFYDGARRSFEFPEGASLHSDLTLELQSDKHNVILERNNSSTDSLLRHQATAQQNSKPMTIVISTKQRPFSSWTFNEFKAQFNLNAAVSYASLKKFELCPVDVEADEQGKEVIDDAFKQTMKIHKTCRDSLSANEACRSLWIFELPKQVTSISANFQILPQKRISGNLGKGPIDYAIEHEGTIIMITEAKREDFDQGASQCLIQLDSRYRH